jgi:hypothetical protein
MTVLIALGIAALVAVLSLVPIAVHVYRMVNDPTLDHMNDSDVRSYIQQRRRAFLAKFPRWLR